MTREDYTSRALGALAWNPDPPDPRDVEAATRCAGDCFDKGFTLTDAIRYLSVLEHVDSTISEWTALKRMQEIDRRYQ